MRKHRIIAGMAAAVLAAGVMALPVSATTPVEFHYTAVSGDNTSAKYYKYLVMDSANDCPAVSFNYTIASGTGVTAKDTSQIDVFAGSVAGVPASGATATFTAGQSTTPGTASDGITNSTSKKYARSEFVFDFSTVSFPEPGVYRYVVSEDDSSFTGGFSADNQQLERTLDVYVKDNGDAAHTLEVQSYVLYDTIITEAFEKVNTINTDSDTAPGHSRVSDDGKKTDGFVNEYTTYDLKFDKTVAGNQASRDKYFKFTVEISQAPGAVINVLGAGSTFQAAPEKNNATKYETAAMATNTVADSNNTLTGSQVQLGTAGTWTNDFYIQNGQSVVISGLPKGASYTITEVNEDYDPAISVKNSAGYDHATGDQTGGASSEIDNIDGAAVSDTYLNGRAEANFTNTRDGQIPTGVILSIAAPCVIGIAVVGGLIVLTVKKKKNESEE